MKMLFGSLLLMAGVIDASALDAKPKLAKGVARAGMLILYDQANFNGDRYEFNKARVQVPMEWNVRSIAVAAGESWELCEKPRYKAPCTTITASAADSSEVGVTGMIGSLRPVKPAKPAK